MKLPYAKVLDRIHEYGLRLKKTKCMFSRKSLSFWDTLSQTHCVSFCNSWYNGCKTCERDGKNLALKVIIPKKIILIVW